MNMSFRLPTLLFHANLAAIKEGGVVRMGVSQSSPASLAHSWLMWL